MKINAETLRKKREQNGWSQQTLADKSKVSKRQIQRLEDAASTSKPASVHSVTINRLAKALGVHMDELAGNTPFRDAPAARSKDLEEALIDRLDAKSILNFDLLTAKYGVTMEEVVLASPMLFAIFAERAAMHYQRTLVERISSGDSEIEIEEIPPTNWETRTSESPEDSIIDRVPIFTRDADSELPGVGNSFIEVTIEALKDSANSSVQLIDLSEGRGWLDMYPGSRIPKIAVLNSVLEKVTCLDPSATWALAWGHVRIKDIPEELMQRNRAIERIEWLRNRNKNDNAHIEQQK